MAERRDTKNRLLNKGEYQKSDGRYMYRYIDAQGESKFVYSWTLTQTDRPPKGRLPCRCLREIEKDIARDLQDQIDFQKARHTTLNALYDDYMEQKHEIKPTTRATYRYTYDTHIRNGLGKRKISDIKYSDIKKLYNGLVRNGTLKASTLGNLHSILHPIFAIAVRDGYIRTNPTAGVLEEVRKINHWEQPKRHALTESEQASLLKFVRTNEMYAFWAPLFIVLLGTGGRIGEIAGLRWDDCDFENGIININHSLQYRPDATTHKLRFAISTPKTQAGRREIPMLSQVKEALLMEKKRQAEEGGCTIEVDGYSGFIFMTRRGNLLAPAHFNRITGDIIRDHNASEQTTAREQGREPVLLPAFSAHTKTLDFGYEPQEVSKEFYNFMVNNATRVSSDTVYWVSGKWEFGDKLVLSMGEDQAVGGNLAINEYVSFTCRGLEYNEFSCCYYIPDATWNVCYTNSVDKWDDTACWGGNSIYEKYRVIDFGTEPQYISEELYIFLVVNATRISD